MDKQAIDKYTRTNKLVNRSVKNSTLLSNSLNARNDELVKKFERAVNNCTSIVESTENGALLEMRDLKSHYSNQAKNQLKKKQVERSLGDLKDLVQQAHKVIGQSRRTRVGASSLMMPKLHLRKPVMLSAAVSPKAQEHCRFPVLSPQSNNKMVDVEALITTPRNGPFILMTPNQINTEDDKLVPNTETVRTLHTD